MKAAILYKPNTELKIENCELEEPGSGEVLVKMQASGVCHSDWHVVKGEWGNVSLPAILGHEGAGIVELVGSGVAGLTIGDHVVLSWKTSCGICEPCQQGWPNICRSSPVAHSAPRLRENGIAVKPMAGLGTFGEYALVPAVAAIPIEKSIPFPQAALIGCGVTTGVGAVISTARVKPGSSVAVFGAGGVGLNCIQGAVIAGATTIIAVDKLDHKLDLAKGFGATHTINSSREESVPRIKEIMDGEGVHYSFEAIGLDAEPFLESIHCTRARGITVWVGHAPLNTQVVIDARDLILEKTVMGSMYGTGRPHVDFPKLLKLYTEGRLKLDELITREFALGDVNEAFTVLSRGEVARSVLHFE